MTVVIGIALFAVGIVLCATGRAGDDGRPGVVNRVLLGAAIACAIVLVAPSQPAQAASDASCRQSGDSVQVTQTSVIEGLAPGAPARPVTGSIANTSADPIHVTAVEVSIISITPRTGRHGPPCDDEDFVLDTPNMFVDRTVPSGGSVPFDGATLGFAPGRVDQDSCQNVTILLLYTVYSAR